MYLVGYGVEETVNMKIYTLEALDEFGRKYGYTLVCQESEFKFDPNWINEYWMRVMVRDILKRMGEDARATWICREDVYA